jgi:hypothetical protein
MSKVNIRCTNAFFVRDRGIVNEHEVVQLSQGEAKDVVAANRGVIITQADYDSATKADFKPRDWDGKVVEPDKSTRAQVKAANRNRAFLAAKQQADDLAASRQTPRRSAGAGQQQPGA